MDHEEHVENWRSTKPDNQKLKEEEMENDDFEFDRMQMIDRRLPQEKWEKIRDAIDCGLNPDDTRNGIIHQKQELAPRPNWQTGWNALQTH